MAEAEGVNNALLDKDVETFGNLCTEITKVLKESDSKLLKLKEKLESMNNETNSKDLKANSFQYLDVKSMLLLNYITSYQYYMLLKAEGVNLESHEIFNRLAYLRLMIEKLKPLDKKVDYQIDKLLRSVVTQSQGNAIIPSRLKAEDNLKYKPNIRNLDTKHMVDQKQDDDFDDEDIEDKNENSDDIDSDELEKFAKDRQKEYAEKHREKEESQVYQAIKFNPVVMSDSRNKGDRQRGDASRARNSKRMTRVDLVKEMKDDLLGLPEEVSYGIASGNKRLLDEEREDEKLEMEHFKRISYTRKETKEREKRRRNLNKSDYTGLTNGFKDFKRIEEFMSKNYSDNEDDEMKKYLDKEKFLEEHRYKKRDKKFKQKEDNRSEENERQSFGFKKRNAKGKKFNKKW